MRRFTGGLGASGQCVVIAYTGDGESKFQLCPKWKSLDSSSMIHSWFVKTMCQDTGIWTQTPIHRASKESLSCDVEAESMSWDAIVWYQK